MDVYERIAALPIIILAVGALVVLFTDLFFKKDWRLPISLLTIGLACFFGWPQFYLSNTCFYGLVYVDSFAWIFTLMILIGTAAVMLLNHRQAALQGISTSVDLDVLMLLSSIGGIVMVSAAHFIVLFLGLELLSISIYALAASAKHERASAESALKYFLLGAFSSSFLLYGMVLIYGATGSMELAVIAKNISISNPMVLVGLGLIIFGMGFKISLVPFHVWTPDVYQGSPTGITTYMAIIVKAAAFGAFLRMVHVSLMDAMPVLGGLVWTLSVITMTLGNLAALRQKSIKRMLAYSSISHAGYAFMGFLALGNSGGEAVVFYIIAYTLMTIASFGVVLVVTAGSISQYDRDTIEGLSGMGWTNPLLGFIMTIAMLSLAGMPPLAGFMGKFYLFNAVIKSQYVGLAIIAALNSVVSLYYYLRVLVVMYFNTERKVSWQVPVNISATARIALCFSVILMVYFGIFAETGIRLAEQAIKSLT